MRIAQDKTIVNDIQYNRTHLLDIPFYNLNVRLKSLFTFLIYTHLLLILVFTPIVEFGFSTINFAIWAIAYSSFRVEKNFFRYILYSVPILDVLIYNIYIFSTVSTVCSEGSTRRCLISRSRISCANRHDCSRRLHFNFIEASFWYTSNERKRGILNQWFFTMVHWFRTLRTNSRRSVRPGRKSPGYWRGYIFAFLDWNSRCEFTKLNKFGRHIPLY